MCDFLQVCFVALKQNNKSIYLYSFIYQKSRCIKKQKTEKKRLIKENNLKFDLWQTVTVKIVQFKCMCTINFFYNLHMLK